MRAALVIVGADGEVTEISIVADTDRDADLVRRALCEWNRASLLKTETASVVTEPGQGSGGAS